jgi:predicted ATPase
LPAEVVQQILAKTDGVPLFVEEVVKMLLESGLVREEADRYRLTGPLPPLAIPTTLQDSLMARLDRLATGKEVAQLGATLGRTFSYDLLKAVAPSDEHTLQQALKQLIEAELLYQHGMPPRATYLFKHTLIQEAAYQSLLRSTRQQFHQRIAQVLEAHFPEIRETQPELLAHHYTEARLMTQAIPCWQQAGERALQRSANLEAMSHLTQALALLQALPDTRERTQQELLVRTILGPALIATKGYAAPEVEQVYRRAQVLCQQVGDTTRLFRVLWGLLGVYLVRAELQTALKLGEELLELAERLQDAACLLEAHRVLGHTLLVLGQPAQARAHLEQGVALYDPQQHRSLALRSGQDPGVDCRALAGMAHWLLGYPDQAWQRSHEALTLAQELAHPHSLAFALLWASRLHQCRREVQLAEARAEAVIALSREQGFPFWLAGGMIFRGWALAQRGQAGEGIAHMRHGLFDRQAMGAELWRPYWLRLLAEAYGKGGQSEEALHVVADALATTDKTQERVDEAELYRLQGELWLVVSAENHPTAETCFHQALDMARGRQVKALELRAAMSLSRLWQQQGKRLAARELLAPIYGWFTEGFDTADLQEARALLKELGG